MWKYGGYTTLFTCGEGFIVINEVLEPNVNKLFSWLQKYCHIANWGESHFLNSTYDKKSMKMHNTVIMSCSIGERVGVLIDTEFNFHDHVIRLCSKAN